MYKKILIATDGSELASQALKQGLELAKATGGSVTFVTVTEMWSALEMANKSNAGSKNPINDYEKTVSVAADKILTQAEGLAKKAGVSSDRVHVKDQHPAVGILQTAKKQRSELIVMASHGRRGVKKVLMGSVASEVLTHSKTAVLIIK